MPHSTDSSRRPGRRFGSPRDRSRFLRSAGAIGLACALAAGPARATEALGPSPPLDRTYFGMHIHNLGSRSTAWPATVDFGALRLWDTYTGWLNLEPRRGEWQFEQLDFIVAEANRRAVPVLLTLGSTPRWASARPDEPCSYGTGCAAEPRDLADWERYVRTVATRYRGRIECYEVWNEFQLPRTEDPTDIRRAIHFYSGDVRQLVALARAAHAQIKAADPGACVASPSVHSAGDWIGKLDRYFAAGGAAVTDVVSFHFYARTPEDVPRLVRAVRAVMRKHGLADKPLWNTEAGFSIDDPNEPESAGGLPLQTAAAYVPRSLVLAAAAGVSRFYWYAWDNRKMGLAANFGRQPNLAATAFVAASRWIRDTSVKACRRDDRTLLWVCELAGADERAWIVWSAIPAAAVPLPLPADAAYVEDLRGNRMPADAEHRTLTVRSEPVKIGFRPGPSAR